VAVDPGDEAGRIGDYVRGRGWVLEAMLLTHAHCDHVGAVDDLRRLCPGAAVYASAETSRRVQDPRTNLSGLFGTPFRVGAADRLVVAGQPFEAAGLLFEPFDVPGHDPGELAYGVRAEGWLLVGDTVFAGGIGRADFPGGDMEALVAHVRGLLASWPAETVILSGHGPETTAGRELASNPFLA